MENHNAGGRNNIQLRAGLTERTGLAGGGGGGGGVEVDVV